DQFIVGVEREIVKDLGVSVNYVHKRGKRYGGWLETQGVYETVPYVDDQGADASGQVIPVQALVSDPADRLFLLTNPPQMSSKFNGVTIQVTKKMSHNWEMVASLVLSKSTGRLGSSLGDPQAEQTSAARRFGQNPNDFINTDGRLIADRP